MGTKEAKIQSAILKLLDQRGAYSIKTIACSKAGIPDIVACYKSTFIGIEVKTPEGVTSKLQEVNLHQIRVAGGVAFIARSVQDVEIVLALLDAERKGA